ncbi:UNVERIFIED_CONTAM: hypothetical protein FKN15_071425 [Acipenser sinensis]
MLLPSSVCWSWLRGSRFLKCQAKKLTSVRNVTYNQGQSPEPRIREYFYYIDHQGQLFLDDSKVKNFISCFKGQSPEPRIREYFYYIDHQGQLFLDDSKVKNFISCFKVVLVLKHSTVFFCLQLFLDDSKVKNFISCFKDKQFLVFFFSRLRRNESGRYQDSFPFLSLCGRERNFVRCDDRPVVFTQLLGGAGGGGGPELLSYCGGAERLVVPFCPTALYMHPGNGRLYHPCVERSGSVGLVRSALAIEFSPRFEYRPGEEHISQPTHFNWAGSRHQLTNELARFFREPGTQQEGQDKQFLVFFFSRLRRNESGRYQDSFPFLSLCGRERNFVRCDDRPVVFTQLLGGADPDSGFSAWLNGSGFRHEGQAADKT